MQHSTYLFEKDTDVPKELPTPSSMESHFPEGRQHLLSTNRRLSKSEGEHPGLFVDNKEINYSKQNEVDRFPSRLENEKPRGHETRHRRLYVRNKSTSPSKARDYRLEHQNSSPMETRRHDLHGSKHYSTETSFLSYLAASKPSAARGLLGVASAALAASRAGTFNPIPDEPSSQWTRNMTDSGKRLEHFCCCTHHLPCCSHCSHSNLWNLHEGFRSKPKRRFSDSFASQPRRRMTSVYPTVDTQYLRYIDSSNADEEEELGFNFDRTNKHEQSIFSRPILHSSLVRLDGVESDNDVFDSPKWPSFTNVGDDLQDGTENDPAYRLFEDPLKIRRRLSPLYVQPIGNTCSRGSDKLGRQYRSSPYGRLKKTGLDTIGWDFMQINGARPGLSQFRHVREMKAARESEIQQEAIQKSRGKASSHQPVFSLLGHTGASPTSSSQPNPFHQLISGGVLGATVLALAGKEKSTATGEKSSEAEKTSKEDKSNPPKVADNTLMENNPDRDVIMHHPSIVMKNEVKESRFDTLPARKQRWSIKPGSTTSLSGLTHGVGNIKKKLFRSTTEATPPRSSHDLLTIPNSSICSLKGNYSAPGLSRQITNDETDKVPHKRVTSFPTVTFLDRKDPNREHNGRYTINRKSKCIAQDSTDDGTITLYQWHNELSPIGYQPNSKRNFTRSLSHETDESLNENLIQSHVKTLSRAKKRRENFKKGRSSAFTWMANENFEQISEYPNEEAIPLIKSLENSSDFVQSNLQEVSFEKMEARDRPQNIPLSQLNAETRNSPLLSFDQTNRKSSTHEDENVNDAKVTGALIAGKYTQEESSKDLLLVRRRRDAMNNQYQQRAIRNVGYRLGLRKRLFEKRCRVSDFALAFALFGIVVMLGEAEFTFADVYRKDSVYSYFAKSLISISTIVLLGLILAYQVYAIKIFSSDDSIEDWRMAVDYNRILQIILELFVCAIHPFPGSHFIQITISPSFIGPVVDFSPLGCPIAVGRDFHKMRNINRLNSSTVFWLNQTNLDRVRFSDDPCDHTYQKARVSVDLILSVPMFLRLYLLLRVMLLHSKMFTDAGSRSIGAMNKVNFDMRFIFKTLMTMCPGKLLLGFVVCVWIIYSWSLRACERFYRSEHASLMNSMWLIAVTFLSIGYGDIVPQTYCGRAIALATGVMGSGCTALIVAVFARKLELSKAEKHVIHFMMENQLNKKVKNYAANVLRETWLIYKFTKLVKKVDAAKVRSHQRKLLRAIHGLRRMKMDQRKVQDSANTLVDLAKTQSNIYETVSDLRMEHNCLNHRIERMETSLLKLQEQLRAIPSLLRTALIQHQKSLSSRATTDTMTNCLTSKQS